MKVEKILRQLQYAIQSRASRSVGLRVQEQGTLLDFGLNRATNVEYQVTLRWGDGEVVFSSDSPHQKGFCLMLDQPTQGGSLRLAIFEAQEKLHPLLVYNGEEPDCPPLWGEILIVATSPNGKDHAVISAAFDGTGHDSILQDGASATARHLRLLHDLHQREPSPLPFEDDEEEEMSYEPYGLAESSPFFSC